ncbi:MAG TPA: DUF4157 domain-containing protein, partial [Candidatus Angelobacter sp.]|nr:DUF4157 domain-containing protein [Candidatus Angelobacter sp.]
MEQKQAAVTNDTARSVSVAREPSPQQSVFHDTPFYFLQRLHGHIGNRAAGRWLQTKLRVGAINDSYEQEADRVADLVMRMPQTRAPEFAGLGTGQVLQRCSCGGTCSSCTALENESPIPVQRLAIASMPPSWIQREATESCSVKEEATSPEEAKEDAEADQPQPGEDPEEEEKQEGKEQQTQVQPKRHAAPAVSPDDIEERLNASRGQGEPLAPETRQIMEDRFGYDFSRVRIHNAAYAHRLNQDLNALAFTTGTDIYFAPSQFQPGTPVGQHLLAHELTHVVQQAGGSGGIVREKAAPGMISRSGKPEDKHDRLLGYYRTLEISGEYVHFRIERILRNADDQLVTEAAIPGADRFGHELNKIGVADLYKSKPAKTVTGVKGYQPVEKPRDIVAMDNPDAVGTKPGVTSLPKISGKRDDPVRPWTGDFPQKIEIGEIKPLSRAKVAAGLFQLDQYTQGYKAFVERIHKISSSTRASIDVERLHLTIPAFLNFDNWATQHSKPESQTTISTRRLWVADIGNGLYVYFDIDHGLIGPPTKWEEEVAKMRKIRADLGDGKHPRTDKMDPLVSGRFLPGGPRLAPPRSTSLPSPRLIQRSTKDRPDNYWAERGRLWEEKRSRWGKAFRAELKTSYRAYRQKLQIEKRLGRTSRSAPAAEKSEVREYKQLMFWSGLPGRFLGKIRFLMGTAWDKVMAIFERMKERMHDLRKKIFGTSEEATFAYGWRKTLIKILVKAAKVAVIKFITESFNFFVQCFESAIDKVWEK